MPIIKTTKQQQSLNARFRKAFNDELGLEAQPFSQELVTKAIQPFFQPQDNVQQMLERAGIVVVADINGILFSYSVTDSPIKAKAQFEQLSQPPFSQIREALGIQHHWICNIEAQDEDYFWDFDLEDWINAHITFEDSEGSTDCWIFDQAKNINER